MAQISRTWWGQKFIRALESFTEPGRLQRGRSYASDSRILSFDITDGIVRAVIRGNVNPYFGVYKEPKYKIEVQLSTIAPQDWSKIIQAMASRASVVARLLINEVPENIENSFVAGQHLLPYGRKDFKAKCSCPDYSDSCKHIAGVCYRLASELDRNPFLLFELRGLSKEALQTELAKSPLGKALASELGDSSSLELEPTTSYFTEPTTFISTEVPTLKQFWQGQKHLPQTISLATPSNVSAIVIKKQGDFPPFWHKDRSFIETMEELYDRVRTKNSGLL